MTEFSNGPKNGKDKTSNGPGLGGLGGNSGGKGGKGDDDNNKNKGLPNFNSPAFRNNAGFDESDLEEALRKNGAPPFPYPGPDEMSPQKTEPIKDEVNSKDYPPPPNEDSLEHEDDKDLDEPEIDSPDD